jgi:hypothetical protein
MSEIWQIIGLSSLIASIINIIGNVITNIYVAKKHFQRESEAGYIQDQIKLYSKIYFLIQRIRVGAISDMFFKDFITEIKELNNIIKNSSFLLETKILMKWFEINKLFFKVLEDKMNRDQFYDKLWPEFDEIASLIREKVNNDLNPRYKEIVGKTVPKLVKVDVERK